MIKLVVDIEKCQIYKQDDKIQKITLKNNWDINE